MRPVAAKPLRKDVRWLIPAVVGKVMNYGCKTCAHPSLGEIEKLAATGAELAPLGRRFGISHYSLRRHWKKHISPERLAALQGKVVFGRDGIDPEMLAQLRTDESDRLILRLAHTRSELNALARGAQSEKVRVQALSVLVRLAEVEAKILGEIRTGTSVTTNTMVVQSGADMAELRSLIDSALAPYPAAHAALCAALARSVQPRLESRIEH